MSKKNFSGGLDSLLGEAKRMQDKPTPKRRPLNSSQEGLKGTETRATFILKEEYIEVIKAKAYWERINIKDIVNDIFEAYVNGLDPKDTERALKEYQKSKERRG